MLVKLGSVWVDPSKVIFMEPCERMPRVFSTVGIVTVEGRIEAAGEVDDFAAIINGNLQTITYGGDIDTAQE